MLERSPEQDIRDAQAWATEWQIRRRNRRWLYIIGAIVAVVLLFYVINFIKIHATRTTFHSEEEMRAALQGRFETDYCEDIEILEDNITLTYYEISHYDLDYAERYGYSEYDDSVYEDKVVKWDYKHGVIKSQWMSDIIVDNNGNLRYYSQTFVRSNDPKPEPIDPKTLTNKEAPETSDREGTPVLGEEEEEAFEASKEGLDETQVDKALGDAIQEQEAAEEAEAAEEGEGETQN